MPASAPESPGHTSLITPSEVIFEENPRRNSLIFAVHLWNPTGPEPQSILEVMHRQKDIQYSSRVASHVARQRQTHRLRHVIRELASYIPEEARNSKVVRELAAYGCLTRMHVVRLLAPRLDNETHAKDIDFSPAGIRQRWEAGYASTRRVIAQAPWTGDFDDLEGVILHEPDDATPVDSIGKGVMVTAPDRRRADDRRDSFVRATMQASVASARRSA